jgi:hypothetical protein
MSYEHGFFAALAVASLALGSGASLADVPVASSWTHHHESFYYFGTVGYTGGRGVHARLEGTVKNLLMFLGARPNLKVRAYDCVHGILPCSLVTADFDTLSAAANAAGADTTQAVWTPFYISAQHPLFMGERDCQLMQTLQPMLTKDFSLRQLDYNLDCRPHQVLMGDYRVQGEVLKPQS